MKLNEKQTQVLPEADAGLFPHARRKIDIFEYPYQ